MFFFFLLHYRRHTDKTPQDKTHTDKPPQQKRHWTKHLVKVLYERVNCGGNSLLQLYPLAAKLTTSHLLPSDNAIAYFTQTLDFYPPGLCKILEASMYGDMRSNGRL